MTAWPKLEVGPSIMRQDAVERYVELGLAVAAPSKSPSLKTKEMPKELAKVYPLLLICWKDVMSLEEGLSRYKGTFRFKGG